VGYLDNNKRRVKDDNFREKLRQIAGIFLDTKRNLGHAVLISHMDADGFASAAILKYMLEREGIPYSTRYYNRKGTWKQYLDGIIPQYDHVENLAVFFSDIGSEINELGRYFNDNKAYVWILDHHEMNPVNEKKLPPNFFYLNPTVYGYDGLKEIAGSTLVYLFAKEISAKNKNTAWIGLIGITNDTLMNVQDYRSYNRMVVEEAAEEQQIKLHQGLMVYGATHENIKNALAYSLFPFVKEVGGNPKLARNILDELQISYKKKVNELDESEILSINNRFPENLLGQYIEFPKKKGILRFAFEHGLLISQVTFNSKQQAELLIGSSSTPLSSTEIYQTYIRSLTKNLGLFVNTPKEVTDNVIFVDASRRLAKNFWSDVASYASVNQLYDTNKILLLGGPDGNVIKLSIRCNEQYPSLGEGKGVDILINKMREDYGGSGGGHKLAGGYKLTPNRYKILKQEIDKYFPL
jgi:single-stranded-DNA-specific exonuclease